jgi:copper chaperone
MNKLIWRILMKKKLLIEGMSCGHCVNHVTTALTEDIEGVKVLEVSLEDKCALVDMDESVQENKLSEVIEDLGFELKGIE